MLSQSLLRLRIHIIFGKSFFLEHLKWNSAKKEFEPDNSLTFKIFIVIGHILLLYVLMKVLPNNIETYTNIKAALEIICTLLLTFVFTVHFYLKQQTHIDVYNKISEIDNYINSCNLNPVNKKSERNIHILLYMSNVFNVYYMGISLYCFRFCNIRKALFYKSSLIILCIYKMGHFAAILLLIRDRFEFLNKLVDDLINKNDTCDDCVYCEASFNNTVIANNLNGSKKHLLCTAHKVR